AKMIRAGYRVAVCDQVEDPKLAKGVVKREVTQVVTPGTVSEENLLISRRNNFIACACVREERCGLAVADVSTGEFTVTEIPVGKLAEEMQAVGPSEILVPDDQVERIHGILSRTGKNVLTTKRESWLFNRNAAYDALTRHFGTTSLKGFGCEDLDAGLSSAGALLSYLQETQKNELRHIGGLRRYTDSDFMILDAAARRNLEILSTMTGEGKDGTLLSLLDRTRTAMGGRLLASWISRPLRHPAPIRVRLDAVEEWIAEKGARQSVSGVLNGMNDIERLIARTVTRRSSPRDLSVLGKTLKRIPDIRSAMADLRAESLVRLRDALEPCPDVVERIHSALTDDPPVQVSDGGVIREGYNADLDGLRTLAFSGKDRIAGMQKTERTRTGIASLKVDYNRVFGYYIEVTKPNLGKVPKEYIRKQTLVNAERFVTPELKELEEKILRAEEESTALERRLFEELRETVASQADTIQKNARRIGELDCLLSMADVAEEYRYVKPVVDEGGAVVIEQGRHPVVERLLPPGTPFIPNDV
ncbi:MAG TPA: DNA mismatch repair protein MutS, partial [bacterium]